MDVLFFLTVVVAGAAAGAVTGLVPGLHVNTLAALLLASTPGAGLATALFLVSVGIVHTFVSILPTTYLGAPGEDTALATLPAHRLLLQGRGPDAVRISAIASLAAVVAVPLVVLPYKWFLLEPGRALEWLQAATPWLLGSVLAFLVAREATRGIGPAAWALAVMAVSGALGWIVLPMGPRGPLPGASGPLLPLLAGLFGAAGLLASMWSAPRIPPQVRGRRCVVRFPGSVRRGMLAAAWTAVLPGLTGAVATALAQPGSRDPRAAIASLSVVNTAHAALALPVLWLAGRPRTGLAQAVDRMVRPEPWIQGVPPPEFATLLAATLVAGAAGHVATRLLDVPLAAVVHRVPARLVSAFGLLLVVALTGLLTGWLGLAILVASTVTGLVPLAAGVRRVHLVAALLVPIIGRWIAA